MRHQTHARPARTRMGAGIRRAAALLLLAAAPMLLGACDGLIDVAAPSRVLAEQLEDPANAALLVNGAVADFECALAQYIVAGGLVGNELEIATTLISMKEYDKRDFKPFGSDYATSTCQDNFSAGVYKPLSTARFQADNTLRLLEEWTDAQVPDRTTLIATVAAYSGYSHVLLGEGMCSAAFDLGPELTPEQIFQRADERFTRVIAAAQAAGKTDLLELALVGRARARLNLGMTAEAVADARQVPADFVFDATYSSESPRRENAVWDRNIRDETVTIDPSYRGLGDPRVPVTNSGTPASDGVTPLWVQSKYSSATSPIPIATGTEAQLIVAEVEGGQTAVDIINTLRTRAGLPAFAGGDAAAITRQVVEERKRELFLDGHHLGDVRRYGIPLTPSPGAPFKDGGGQYQAQTCFPLPDVERVNNPSIPKTGG